MCTALSFKRGAHFFGRNLDLEFSYGESIAITPRKFAFRFTDGSERADHYAIIGVAHVVEGYPLYFDGVNEEGLGVAALNFPGYARYHKNKTGAVNIAPFELIPRVLSECASVDEAERLLKNANLVDTDFSERMKNTPLHWIVADSRRAIVVESVEEGLRVYDNPVGVLTNNPPFPVQMFRLNDYKLLSPEPAQNNFSKGLDLQNYSRGLGTMGLPGGLDSASRFVKAAFTAENSVCGSEPREALAQFFQILGSVAQQRGCVHLGEGKYEYTIYSSCCDTANGILYYTTYSGTCLAAVDMHRENLEGDRVIAYPMEVTGEVKYFN